LTLARAGSATVRAALVVTTLMLAGCAAGKHQGDPTATGTPRHEPTYGSLPTFLPTPTLRADAELTGTPRRPAVTTEGDAVRAVLDTGAVRATVTGPVVPVQGAASEPDTTTCTWTVALSGVRGRTPLAVRAFTVLDEQGHQTRPRLAPGSSRPPAAIGPGQIVRFELRAVMSVGEGVVRWAPAGRVVASWDFVAETD
jgi:hypothetical protein